MALEVRDSSTFAWHLQMVMQVAILFAISAAAFIWAGLGLLNRSAQSFNPSGLSSSAESMVSSLLKFFAKTSVGALSLAYVSFAFNGGSTIPSVGEKAKLFYGYCKWGALSNPPFSQASPESAQSARQEFEKVKIRLEECEQRRFLNFRKGREKRKATERNQIPKLGSATGRLPAFSKFVAHPAPLRPGTRFVARNLC